MFEKIKLLDMPDIYTANAFCLDGELCIGLGPERIGTPCLLSYPLLNKMEIGAGPGGVMSIIPVPGRPGMLVSVMGLFPPFQGKEAGIYKHVRTESAWNATKVIHLPFAHRCEILYKNQVNYLFISTVSKYKQSPSDWSEPGEVFLSVLPDTSQVVWETEKIIGAISRNHGMLKTTVDGEEVICVSGDEGIFSLCPGNKGSGVRVTLLFNKEVSEFSFIDLDEDGVEEMVTIEPFHGNSLNIYKQISGRWKKIYDAPLSFGHGLSSGKLAGRAVVAVGNRSGEAALELFCISEKSTCQFKRVCVENKTGTTQTQLFHYKDKDFLLSANQLKGEAALYYPKEGFWL